MKGKKQNFPIVVDSTKSQNTWVPLLECKHPRDNTMTMEHVLRALIEAEVLLSCLLSEEDRKLFRHLPGNVVHFVETIPENDVGDKDWNDCQVSLKQNFQNLNVFHLPNNKRLEELANILQ